MKALGRPLDGIEVQPARSCDGWTGSKALLCLADRLIRAPQPRLVRT